ncbi:hypothetical protein Goshw_018750 [Gossypium schwendimanii]|uniref:Uncharacterized protein n=1 Tax=Gossypium schwendimanii TaxID=34291 RepID=A0A7J9ND24_GOSSC|nr:hypothetical protein [Gossypium schwendimanii]
MRLSELGLKQRSERKAIVWLMDICFTFGKVHLVPTIEEYVALFRCSKFQVDSLLESYKCANFLKKLMNITGMSEHWVAA